VFTYNERSNRGRIASHLGYILRNLVFFEGIKNSWETLKAFADQIDAGMAKLLLGEDASISLVIPLEWIACPVQEGDALRLIHTKDETVTQQAKLQVSQLLDELGDNP